jgi:hypothetical protein
MCVSLHPARFSDTTVGAFIGTDGRRYLAYQNTAANLPSISGGSAPAVVSSTARKPVRRGTRRSGGADNWNFEGAVTPKATGKAAATSGNAMILPIPDAVANIELIDTTTCPNFLKDIRSALTPRTRGGLRRGGAADSAKSVRIIEFDVYTIVIAKNAKDLTKVLKSDAIPAERRPALNDEIIKAYTKWYPNWAIAVCCFNNTDAKRAKPLLFSYEPTKQADKDFLFVPTLDAHDGKAPDLNANVDVDHTIFVSTPDMPDSHGMTVFYSDPEIALGVAELLPRKVTGKVVSGSYRNGDVVFKCSDLKNGIVRGLRALPPGAPKVDTKEFI